MMRKKHDRTRRIAPADYFQLAHDSWDGIQRKDTAARLNLSRASVTSMLKSDTYKKIETEVFAEKRAQALRTPATARREWHQNAAV